MLDGSFKNHIAEHENTDQIQIGDEKFLPLTWPPASTNSMDELRHLDNVETLVAGIDFKKFREDFKKL